MRMGVNARMDGRASAVKHVRLHRRISYLLENG